MSQGAAAALRARELGEAIDGHPENVDAALPELAALLAVATDDDVILETVRAIGHVWDDRGPKLLLPLAQAGHTDPEIRQAVAAGLAIGVETEAVRQQVISALLPMTTDPDSSVRNWACFSLGAVDADGPEIREALAARLDDEDAETQAEALVALARIGDPRALEATLERLAGDSDAITLLELRAAGELADPALLPALGVLAENWAADDDEHTELLAQARSRCAADAASRAADFEVQFLAEITQRLTGTGVDVTLDGQYPRTLLRFATTDGRPSVEPPSRLWDDMESPESIDLEVVVSGAELLAAHTVRR